MIRKMSDGPPRGRARGRGLDVPQQPGGAAAPPRAQHLRPAAPMQPRMRSAGPQPQVRAPRPAAQQQQQQQFRGMRPAGGPQHPSPITDAPSAWQRSPHVAMLPLPQPGHATSRQAAPPLPPPQQPAPTVRPEQPPATHASRAYCRGTERVQSAIRSAQQTSGESSLPLQMSALSVEQANSGNGSNGNGSNGTGKLRRTNDMNLLVNYFEMEKFHMLWFNVEVCGNGGSPAQDDRRQRYKIMEPHLKHFGGHVFDGMNIFSLNYLPNKLDSLDDQFIRILNLILRRCQAAIGLTLIGRHYFNVKNFQNLDADLNCESGLVIRACVRMRVYPGVQTSIRQHEDKILLNVDIVHKFQQQTSILDHIRTMRNDDRDRLLIGQIAMAEYNHLTYRIDHFDDTKNPMSTFQHRGETVTFKKYFEDKHRRIVTDLTQPLIYSKPTGRQLRSGMTEIYLVPELMRLTGIPDDIRTNFHKMKRLVDYTKMGVDRRVAALKKFNQDLQEDKVRKDLELWGLKLNTNLVSLTSGVMNQEEILLAGGMSAQYKADDADWTFGCRNKSMMVSIPLNNWVVLVGGRINVADVSAFIQMLQQAARSVGMMIRPPEMVQASGMHETEQEIMKHQGCQMIMIILDRQLQNKYGMLKKKLACSIGVLSQASIIYRVASNIAFVLASNVNPAKKGLMSIATKIAIQMNAKLGGEPWQVKQPAKTTMVIGYDVYHDTVTASKSYGAVVSSVNPQLTNYYGQVTEHNNKEELSNNFAVCIQKAVKAYHERNKCHPRNVVVYRDGVGEGQIEYVKQQEIPAIKSELAKINPGICLVFVVVCKRINTRIFRDMGSGGLANPPPGTVVDKTITLPYCYDFFLVSQKVREGTVSPTSYSILEDGSNFSVDMLQCFTYKLTHLYFNWQGTVRVPAPCLYAHKLAYMTGTGTHSQPSPRVADKLW
ncbi:hypothetical protein HAZT_HAZT000406 [Hyalella azteca]|uniref:Piwi domain-containing protein n=1 Tax=Hyalella azteca TaxID=294128 RepID=A0A6A0GTN8_HYAAZ|nr:hypothetical protein HAZT_HAZT000406 [Hyalella azteca]